MKTALAAVIFVLAGSIPSADPPCAQGAEPPPPGTPTFAVEDTMPVPSALLPEFLVTAPRVTLDEILQRVAAGETRRDSMMRDQSYILVALLTYIDPGKGGKGTEAKRKLEVASQVYKKQPDHVREVRLRQSSDFKDDDDVDFSINPSMREQLVSFAFEPRNRSKFQFSIESRHLIGGHVVYLIGFVPRSKIDPLPTGRVWIDTNDFVIVREEFWFRDRSPSPMFFKSIDSCVLERTKVDGQWWVLSRFLARIQLTSLARFMGKVARETVPQTVDFTLMQTDWKVNQGIDDAIFETKKGGKKSGSSTAESPGSGSGNK